MESRILSSARSEYIGNFGLPEHEVMPTSPIILDTQLPAERLRSPRVDLEVVGQSLRAVLERVLEVDLPDRRGFDGLVVIHQADGRCIGLPGDTHADGETGTLDLGTETVQAREHLVS